jgi:hypothetical protein
MQNETPLKQGLQQEPVSQVTQGSELKAQSPEPQVQGPKPKAQSSKGLLIVIAIFGFLLLIGGSIGGYLLWKNNKEKDSSTDTEVEQTEEDESTTTTTTTETTEDSTDSTEDETEEVDPYEGWETYENTDYGFSFRYPSHWETPEFSEYEFIDPDDPPFSVGIELEGEYLFGLYSNPSDGPHIGYVQETRKLKEEEITVEGEQVQVLWSNAPEYMDYLYFATSDLYYSEEASFGIDFYTNTEADWQIYKKIFQSAKFDLE